MTDHGIEGIGEVDANDLLELLGGDNVHDVGADEVGFSCFYEAGHSHGDQNPSAHLNRDALVWRCKGCGRAGNLPELVRLALPHGTTFPEALAWLREHFGEVVRKPRGGSLGADLARRLAKPEVREPVLPVEGETIGPQGILYMDWRSDHDAAVYMRETRGFAPEVLEDWGFGYDSWTRRIAIPVRNEEGILVGFKGRSLGDGRPKYLLLGDTEGRSLRYDTGYGFDMHDHSTVVFGLDRAIRFYRTAEVPAELRPSQPGQLDARDVRPGQQSSASRSKRVAMPEGELNAVACWAAGVPAVAPGTTSITDQQLWLLRAHFDEIVTFYDSDDAGENAIWGYFDESSQKWRPGLAEKITPYFRFYVVDDHEGDPASMRVDEIESLYESAQHWIRYSLPSESSV